MNIEANLKRIIQAEADAVRAIDVQPTFANVELIQGTSGRVVATGIGTRIHRSKICSNACLYWYACLFHTPCRSGTRRPWHARIR